MRREPGVSKKQARILVVDDEVNIREALAALLEDDGYHASKAASITEALDVLKKDRFDLVISDLRLNGQSGLYILRWMRETCPETEMIILTAYGTVEGAVEAMKLGAYDYIAKPVDRRRLGLLIEKALEKHRLSIENRNLRRRLSIKEEFSSIIGNSARIRAVFKLMAEVAPSNATVLITGESGTGKELVAKSIHNRSQRRERAFVTLNCGALPDTLIESELFGYETGAFTGAYTNKIGRLVLLTKSDTIEPKDLPDPIREAEGRAAEITLRLDQSLEEMEKAVIGWVLSQVTQNRTLAARIMGISLRALHYKIKRYGLDTE